MRGFLTHRIRSVTSCVALALSAAAVGVAGPAGMVGPAAAAGYDPATDPYSMQSTTATTGAQSWWSAGYTGAGVDVAVIDTGVAPVAGLDGVDKVVNGPDLSFESQNPALAYLDTNGHGTFMAGLIAGRDATATKPYASAPATSYRGIAPDARIVNLKVGVADGGVDITQVIAAVNWVVQHKTDNGLNIRVISLSYGTNSSQKYDVDPLSYAVEQAWKKGIVVVAAAGNAGFQKGGGAPGVASPSYNPYVISIGGVDSLGTAALTDDVVGTYSSSGCGATCRNPDFVTQGSHVQGLRVPGSFIDQTHPEGMLDARYFRGSGTSEATAITSGAIALILQKYPSLTPDAVKNFIKSNGLKLTNKAGKTEPQAQGNGQMQLGLLLGKAPAASTQKFANGTGSGSLELARGTDHLSADGVVLTGELDIFGHAFASSGIAAAEAAGTTWSGGVFNGNTWSGSSWAGKSWAGSSWAGKSWAGKSWAGSSWAGNTWSGSSWSGSAWSGSSWSGSTWSGGSWATGSWT